MLKLIDLATRPDFRLGGLFVSPARRLVEGPAGHTTVEPLVMKAFLLLLDARGQVVTREELFDTCWGGAMVGDDSLNRAVARVRRIASETGPDLFEITAIPRTGYRLTGKIVDADEGSPAAFAANPGVPRRTLLVGAVALAATAVAGSLWYSHEQKSERFDSLIAKGEDALDYGHPSHDPAPFLAEAVQIRPHDAAANGLLALAAALDVENGSPATSDSMLSTAQQAAKSALALDPAEPNANLASIMLQSSTLDLITTEERLLAILHTDPTNTWVMRALWDLYQSTGRSRDAFGLVEKANSLKPLAPANNYPRAQLLWILGRTAEADRVIDRAMHLWPAHPFIRFARFMIFAYDGEADAALAMLNGEDTRPQSFTPGLVAMWRSSLPALADPTPGNVEAARTACMRGGATDKAVSYFGMMVLSALGQVDAAFDLADDFLLFRKPVAATISHAPPVRSTSWRFTPGLFTPATAAMRADPRFKQLCDGIGLTDYWQRRGIKPDYQVG